MKVTIHRDTLLAACRLAGRLLPQHAVNPAQEHFLLRAGTDAAVGSLHAAGPEASLRLPLTMQTEQLGEALLPARAAIAVLRAGTSAEVSLESMPGSLLLRWPGARYRLQSPVKALFPPDEPTCAGPCLLLSAHELPRAIRSTLFATGSGSRRFRFDGVLVEGEPNLLRIIATDNRRLAVAELPATARCENFSPQARVLPAVAVAVLALLAETGEEPVALFFGAERAFFTVGKALLACRYETGPYPSWRSAVPASPPCCLEVPVAGLLGAVRQAAVLRERETARLLVSLEPDRLVLESGRIGAGCARVARKVAYQGGCVRVALESRYLVELLRCLEEEATVEMGLTDADTPALFRAGGYVHVLMPLRSE